MGRVVVVVEEVWEGGETPCLQLASSAGPAQKSGKVLLAKIPVCAVSAVFIWSRGITFVHYQLLNS